MSVLVTRSALRSVLVTPGAFYFVNILSIIG